METKELTTTTKHVDPISALLNQDVVKKRFQEVLGKKAPGFMSSIISAVNANPSLKKADPMSIVSAAAVAASLDLPINPSLGFAHIVPYKRDGVPVAQFQMGWRGFVQLGMRSGQYKTMNACVVYEGELLEANKFTGEMVFDENQKSSDKVIGFVAYFRLHNGFEKYLYMTVDQMTEHAKRYSKTYNRDDSKWKTDFNPMGLKTVIKMLLSKFGILSIEMQSAIQYDQAIIKDLHGGYDYIDNDAPQGTQGTDEPIMTDDDKQKTLAQFDQTIPAGADPVIVNEFLTRTAESNKVTVDEVKVEASKDLKAFWKVFKAYAKTRKPADKPREINQTVDMAPAPCPDDPETSFTKDHCDKCGKRQGCPVWA